MTRPLPPVTRDLLRLNDDPFFREHYQCYMFAIGLDSIEFDTLVHEIKNGVFPWSNSNFPSDRLGFPSWVYQGFRAHTPLHLSTSENARRSDYLMLREGFEPIKFAEARTYALAGSRVVHAFGPMHFILELPDGENGEELIHKNGFKPVECMTRMQLLEYMTKRHGTYYVGSYIIPNDRVRYDERLSRKPTYSAEARKRMADTLKYWMSAEYISLRHCVAELNGLGFSREERSDLLARSVEVLRRRIKNIPDIVPESPRMEKRRNDRLTRRLKL